MSEGSERDRKVSYWQKVGLYVREGYKMHRVTGQLDRGPNNWRNVTEHCLVQVARSETLSRWIGLPEDMILNIRMGAILHDFDKKQEITVTLQANRTGMSPLAAVRAEEKKAEILLTTAGFNDRVRRLTSASGGDAPVLFEAQRILDQDTLSDDDLAFLIVHYVDDCSIGTDWVLPTQESRNIIDYRMQQNKAKIDYNIIGQEIACALSPHPKLGGMHNLDAASFVSHQIEQRLAQRIRETTGEEIDPLTIPETVDQKIREES